MLRSTARRWVVLLFIVGAVLPLALLHVSGRQRTPLAASVHGPSVPDVASAPTERAARVSTAQQPSATTPPSSKMPAGTIPVDKAPFDVGAVIERVQRTFEAKDGGFRGGRAEYGVRASADGIALTARHWEQQERASSSSPAGNEPPKARHEHAARKERVVSDKPLESPELVLRTTHVGRGAAPASGTFGDDVPVLEDDAQLVAWKRDAHIEHLRQTPAGVEQSWEFASKPEGRDDLLVRVDVSGLDFKHESEQGLHFADARGLGFHYGHGTWIDAAGVKTAVNAHYVNGAIELVVPSDVVERSAYPAVLDPVVGPEFELEEVLGPAYRSQETPSVASNGNGYLLAWWDDRWGPLGIYVSRVSGAGEVLDGSGLSLSGDGSTVGSPPSVASDGDGYLVVWTGRSGVHANRVSTNGEILDGAGFSLGEGGRLSSPRVSVASNGSEYLVAWDGCTSATSAICARRVSAQGEAEGEVLTLSSAGYDPSVASNGSDYLVVWGAGNIHANRVSAAGVVQDSDGFAVSSTSAGQAAPSVASDGSDYFVVWEDNRSGQQSIDGNRVSAAGEVGTELDLVTSGESASPSVASDGSGYLVVWREGPRESGDIYAARFDAAGGALDGDGMQLSNTSGLHEPPTVAFNGSEYLVLWGRLAYDHTWATGDILASRVSAAGVVQEGTGSVLLTSSNGQRASSVASNGSDYLFVWEDWRSGDPDIYASRVSAAGVVQDGAGFVVSSSLAHQRSPSVASNGSDYLVAWTDDVLINDGEDSDANVYAKRVSAAGVVLDDAELTISEGELDQDSPQIASNGADYLVVWQKDRLYPDTDWGLTYEDIYARRVTSAGEVLDGPGLAVATSLGDKGVPSVASNGSDYLVVWEHWGESKSLDISASRVSAAGNVQDPDGFPVSTAPERQANPSVASNGRDYLVAWEDDRSGSSGDIYASRVNAAGKVVNAAELVVSSRPSAQVDPTVASNGGDYVVAWREERASGEWNIEAATIAFEPLVQVSEITLDDSGRNLGRPLLIDSGGRYLVSYQKEVNGVPKVRARLLGADCDPLGDADSDAVCDSQDNCPADSNFGQEDADGDSVGNACDACPEDPSKITDADTDGDGTANCADECSTDPHKTTAGECGCGVSEDVCAPVGQGGTAGGGAPGGGAAGAGARNAGAGEGGCAAGSCGEGGAQDTSGGKSDDESTSGCGCRTAGGTGGSSADVVLLIASAALVVGRRRMRAA